MSGRGRAGQYGDILSQHVIALGAPTTIPREERQMASCLRGPLHRSGADHKVDVKRAENIPQPPKRCRSSCVMVSREGRELASTTPLAAVGTHLSDSMKPYSTSRPNKRIEEFMGDSSFGAPAVERFHNRLVVPVHRNLCPA